MATVAVGSGRHIVLAEDDREMRRLLERALSRHGFMVEPLATGTALMQRVESGSHAAVGIDLVISDIRMPGVLGLEVLRELRHRGSNMPFILMTAFSDDTLADEAIALGAAALFSKPFDIDDLCTMACCVLESP